MRIYKKNLLISLFWNFFINYPVPINLSYFWNFGIYSFICLIIQIITGILLAMHYISDQTYAFLSIEYIMRDIYYGWLIRYIHANGASIFFIVVYIHLFRGFYYSLYMKPREIIWSLGILILLLMILTAFLGYVLPWGQMSFWAATVITNLLSVIPIIGNNLVIWLWGGYSVNNATLTRFLSLHYLFPFIILSFVFLHFIFLHEISSNNPLGIEFKYIDYIYMYPFYILKDLYGILLLLIFFTFFIFFFPNLLGHTDNYISANSLVTPLHIVPEWYFLPFYTILRSIPDKLFGVIFMLLSILILFILPFILIFEVQSLEFRPLSRSIFWLFLIICFLLGWIGGNLAKFPYIQIGQILTLCYFIYSLFLLNFLQFLEKFLWEK